MIALNRLKDQDTRVVVFHFSVVASSFLLATLAFSDGWNFSRTAMLDGRIVVMLLGVGGAATVGQLFLTLAFAAGPPSEVAVVGLTQVVFAFGYDTWISGHTFDGITLTGMLLVIAPTAWLLATVRRRIADGTTS